MLSPIRALRPNQHMQAVEGLQLLALLQFDHLSHRIPRQLVQLRPPELALREDQALWLRAIVRRRILPAARAPQELA